MTTGTTAIDYLRNRLGVRTRSSDERARDAEETANKAAGEASVLRTERNMLARQVKSRIMECARKDRQIAASTALIMEKDAKIAGYLAEIARLSELVAEYRVDMACAITVTGRHKEHDDCRHLSQRLAAKLEATR
jgi:translation initiation factor IF-2